MQPNDVLKFYLELCDKPNGFIQNHLASNAVFDWFGRSIKGSHRIYYHIRYVLSQEYEHYFENARYCDAIEARPTHFETKRISKSDIEMSKSCSLMETSQEFDNIKTPIQEYKSPILPPLNQGRIFRQMSDEDLSDLGLSRINDSVNTPCKSLEPKQKKFKSFSIQNNETSQTTEINTEQNDILEELNDSSLTLMDNNDEEEFTQEYNNTDESNGTYNVKHNLTELKYIESIGILLPLNKPKHRETMNYNSTLSNIGSISSNFFKYKNICENENNFTKDRKVRLKLSYRINKNDNHIQFALIIYEHEIPNPLVKRNLISEFEKIEINDVAITKNEVKRKNPTKRILRL